MIARWKGHPCYSVRSCQSHDTGGDRDTVREYAQVLEAAGYDFPEAPDHGLGANVASRPGWDPDRNTAQDLFHDPSVLLSYVVQDRRETGDQAAMAVGGNVSLAGCAR
jgi:hypothetical protein